MRTQTYTISRKLYTVPCTIVFYTVQSPRSTGGCRLCTQRRNRLPSAPAPLWRARAGSAPGQQRIHWSATIGVHRPLGLGYRLVRVRVRVRVWVRVWVRVGVRVWIRDRVTVRVSACRAAHASVRMACSSCTCTSTTRGALAARSLRREAPRSWLGLGLCLGLCLRLGLGLG